MPDNFGQLSPVRNQGLVPSAVPTHPAATSTASTRQGINDIGTNDYGESMSVISEEDLAKLLDELGQIRVSIDDYFNDIDQRGNSRATIEEAVQQWNSRIGQINLVAINAARQRLICGCSLLKEHLETVRAAWSDRAEQASRDHDQPGQAQQEGEEPPAVDGALPTEEDGAQGNDDGAVPLHEGEAESSHGPDANPPIGDDGGPDYLLGRIPILYPDGPVDVFNATFTAFMSDIITLVGRRTHCIPALKQKVANLEQRIHSIEEVSDRLDQTIRLELPSRMARLEGGLAQSDTNFNANLTALRAELEASAGGVMSLQREVRQVAGQVNDQAAIVAAHGHELAAYESAFERVRTSQVNLERQFGSLRDGAGPAPQRPQPLPRLSQQQGRADLGCVEQIRNDMSNQLCGPVVPQPRGGDHRVPGLVALSNDSPAGQCFGPARFEGRESAPANTAG